MNESAGMAQKRNNPPFPTVLLLMWLSNTLNQAVYLLIKLKVAQLAFVSKHTWSWKSHFILCDIFCLQIVCPYLYMLAYESPLKVYKETEIGRRKFYVLCSVHTALYTYCWKYNLKNVLSIKFRNMPLFNIMISEHN